MRNVEKGEKSKGERGLPSPKSNLNPMEMSWNNEVWKEVIEKLSRGPREHCEH